MKQAFSKMALKKDHFYDGVVFKDFVKHFTEDACSLLQDLIQFINFKEDEGTNNEFVRRQMLDNLHYLVSGKHTSVQITPHLKKNAKNLNSLLKNLFMKQELIKKNKNAFFVKVANTLNEILKPLDQETKKTVL